MRCGATVKAWNQRVGDTVKYDRIWFNSSYHQGYTNSQSLQWQTGCPDSSSHWSGCVGASGRTNVLPAKTEGGWREGITRRRYDSIVQWLWDKTIPILSPPSNYPPILTILKCCFLKPARRLVHWQYRQHGQLFKETLTDSYGTHMLVKQNVQGTNAWLWYMCNRVVLIYSYSMNFPF